MSIKTNKPRKTVGRDYGRRFYVSDDEYQEQMREGTQKAMEMQATYEEALAEIYKHSEFKKPYLEDDYLEMEYTEDLPYDNYDAPWDTGGPVPDYGEAYTPWHILFDCDTRLCWCPGATTSKALSCTQEIVGVTVQPIDQSTFSASVSGNVLTITAADNAKGYCYLTVHLRAPVPEGGTPWQGKYDPVPGETTLVINQCSESECCGGCLTESPTISYTTQDMNGGATQNLSVANYGS